MISPAAEDILAAIRERRGPPTPEKLLEMARQERSAKFASMVVLAEIDPGMKDLLDRAEEYYVLKSSPKKTARDRLEDIRDALRR